MGKLATIAIAAAMVLCTAGGCVVQASASQLIDRNATGLSLQLNASGEALLTYRAAGRLRHVLAWGAVNAMPPRAGVPQTKLRLDYSGGYEKYFKENPAAQKLAAEYARIREHPRLSGEPGRQGAAARTTGSRPLLEDRVPRWLRHVRRARDRLGRVTCKAADGCYWAIQEWQRELPDYGAAPTPRPGGLGASPVALDRPAPGADGAHRLGLAPVGPPLRDAHLPGIRSFGFSSTQARQPARQLRAQRLHRHLRLGLRARLAAGEQRSDARGHRASSVTASTRTTLTRPVPGRSTGSR